MPNSKDATSAPIAATTGAADCGRHGGMVLLERDAREIARALSAAVPPALKAIAAGQLVETGPRFAGMNRANAANCRRRCRTST
jgi:hypothetical protein